MIYGNALRMALKAVLGAFPVPDEVSHRDGECPLVGAVCLEWAGKEKSHAGKRSAACSFSQMVIDRYVCMVVECVYTDLWRCLPWHKRLVTSVSRLM